MVLLLEVLCVCTTQQVAGTDLHTCQLIYCISVLAGVHICGRASQAAVEAACVYASHMHLNVALIDSHFGARPPPKKNETRAGPFGRRGSVILQVCCEITHGTHPGDLEFLSEHVDKVTQGMGGA